MANEINTFFVRSLTAQTETLISQAKSDNIKTELRKIYEIIRYSDPVSNEELASVEEGIKLQFASLSDAVEANDIELVKAIGSNLSAAIIDRNNQSKLLKK